MPTDVNQKAAQNVGEEEASMTAAATAAKKLREIFIHTYIYIHI